MIGRIYAKAYEEANRYEQSIANNQECLAELAKVKEEMTSAQKYGVSCTATEIWFT